MPAPVTRTRDELPTRTPGRGTEARDNVYRGPAVSPRTRTDDAAPRPYPGTVRSPVAPTQRTPANTGNREPGVRPRPSEARPGRYAPRDGVPRTNTNAVPPRGRSPESATSNVRAPAAAADATPRLVPRSTSPRLTVPRSATTSGASLVSGLRAPARAYDHGSHYGHRDSCRRVFWNTWWDPCRYDSWSSWSWYGGCSTFGWSFSFWHPWHWYRTRYWNSCYFDTWWYLRSRPTCASTNYWWYPSSTYCPTYLYVPGSSVVYVEREPAPAPAETEVVVAGTGVVDRGSIARVVDTPDSAAARAESTETLAKKYVELGDFYFEAGRFTDAADAYSRARSYSPDNASIHFALADASFATGDYHFAAFLIAEAVRLQPSIVSAEIDRRVYYGDPKLFEQQMDELNRYVETKPYDAQAQLVLGYNLRFSGKPVAAGAAFRRVLQVSPENRAAAAFLAALEPAGSEATIR